MVEHIVGGGEHHAGDAVGHADVRKGAELPGVEHLLQHESIGHANGSFCRAAALFQGWWLRLGEHKTALGIEAESELDGFCRSGLHGVQAEYLTMFSSWAAAL